nr:serrate RNA effector molecule-like isoform X3 [Physcomitrium patens]|eukprot:XP_024398983.1 serrate RNA effector molecule-like isoform X3 [Physcomitrella patens]
MYGGFDGVGPYGRGRGGYRDGPYPSMYGSRPPPRRDGLMSYKQFIVELEDDILPGEAERRYEEYKSEFITTQKRAFFEQHKDDDWLREKYDPARLEIVLVSDPSCHCRRNENAKILSKELLAELQAGSLDLGPSVRSSSKDDSGDDADGNNKRRKSSQEHVKAQETIVAPTAHPGCSDPQRVLKDIELGRSLIKKLDAEKGIEGNLLSVDQNTENERTVGGGSVGPIVIVRSGNHVKGLEGTELLDVVLTYLWRVHSVDYYGMIEYKEQPKRLRHIRAPEGKSGGDTKNGTEGAGFADWEKKLDTTWQTRLQGGDIIVSMLGREKLDTTANEALDPFVRKIRDEKYGWKYGCGAKGCTKLFHGPEFVHKHLKLKHSDLVADVVAKAREELYFQNYMSDPDAPGANQVTSSQPGQRDDDRGRRGLRPGLSGPIGGPGNRAGPDWPPSDHPSRDGRFGPRNGDRYDQGPGAREEQRFERGTRDEKGRFDRGGLELTPPPRDYPLGAGGPPFEGGGPAQGGPFEGGPMEPPMFDHFNGPPVRGLPGGLFVPDMPGPPQVLMPVPGAGPLGPFVPAPPEIAMRFLREGPGPFRMGGFDAGYQEEGNGGPRGGKRGAPGPMMEGGLLDIPPNMMPPHGMRRDPRGVRSYHDLDAPEDEVSVIDYRSL